MSSSPAPSVDALAVATYAVWQSNGHYLPAALLTVSHNAADPALAELAAQAHDAILRYRAMWDAFEADFNARTHDDLRADIADTLKGTKWECSAEDMTPDQG